MPPAPRSTDDERVFHSPRVCFPTDLGGGGDEQSTQAVAVTVTSNMGTWGTTEGGAGVGGNELKLDTEAAGTPVWWQAPVLDGGEDYEVSIRLSCTRRTAPGGSGSAVGGGEEGGGEEGGGAPPTRLIAGLATAFSTHPLWNASAVTNVGRVFKVGDSLSLSLSFPALQSNALGQGPAGPGELLRGYCGARSSVAFVVRVRLETGEAGTDGFAGDGELAGSGGGPDASLGLQADASGSVFGVIEQPGR